MTRKRKSPQDAIVIPINVRRSDSPPEPESIRHTLLSVPTTGRPEYTVTHHLRSLVLPQAELTPEPEVAPGGFEDGGWVDEDDGQGRQPGTSHQDGGQPRKRRRLGHRFRVCRSISFVSVNSLLLQKNPLRQWMPFRDVFLDEMLRHDGMREAVVDEVHFLPTCHGCGREGAGILRCTDCAYPHLYCESCIVSVHANLPLHRVQKWNGMFFEQSSLASAGLVIQLGHDGCVCSLPKLMEQPLTVIDVSGIHEVYYQLCDCTTSEATRPFVQLLRIGWWPATITRPRTVVTLRTLRLFHALTLQSKVNGYDFYNGLVRITDGAGLRGLKNRYKEFMRSMRCFRHLRMAKRAGRGHDPLGILGTKSGELVVVCPACPDPETNLPEGWQDDPERRWKYALILAVDANFKLKLKKRKNAKDVQLCDGWAYFVADREYKAHLAVHTDEAELKTCTSTHNAMTAANMPTHKRFAVNGVGAAICSRHTLYRAHGVGDLQKGERYVNMDYVVLSSLGKSASKLRTFYFSYDISCQWSKNFYKRLKSRFPNKTWLAARDRQLKFLVPKFHLQAHGEPCQIAYSHNYTEGVGRTCGEGIEAGWADTNGAALSTREMSASYRHEALDDFFGAINWRKTVTMGAYLLKSLKNTMPAYEKQRLIFEELEKTVPPDIRTKWEQAVFDWDRDGSKPNPYQEPVCTNTTANMRLELAQEEAEEAARGIVALHEMSASVFLNVGLELEEQQYVLLVSKAHPTSMERASLQAKRNTLQHRIQTWRTVQQLYMPGSLTVVNAESSASAAVETSRPALAEKAENLKLWLPSELSESLRVAGCSAGLVDKEVRLRTAQADDALHQIRRQLRLRLAWVHEKKIHIDGPGQGAMTRSHATLKRVNEKLQRFVAKYRRARAALVILSPGGSWEAQLRVLADEDIRSPTKDEEGLGKDKRVLSWIWRVQTQDARDIPGENPASEEEVHESMRVEWVQCRARTRRWREERDTLLEEMRRTVTTFLARSEAWTARINSRLSLPLDIERGLNAYARRQAAMYRGLAASFHRLWAPKVDAFGLSVEWPVFPAPEVAAPNTTSSPNVDITPAPFPAIDFSVNEEMASSRPDAPSADGSDSDSESDSDASGSGSDSGMMSDPYDSD
ncbi:hypothetical protein BV25DRAFT_1816134 [Artomyces pyxidatus]|uniref:Uncharacterized protein n=1 Tax=Artomyces pyxidatus TaxID=48021 RepID=A0ACB8SGB3_9AGAM|nr:hypothetical protein BV25DRAFT_1816134 [Artomyces pyxidatus]